jgi:PAS domain S-box-containing protein
VGELAASADRNQGMDASEATRDDHHATITVDRDGVIRQWSDAVTDLVGHSADETLGRNLDVVIPPVLRPVHWWGFDRTMSRGRPGDRDTMTVPALRKDGRIVVAHATIELIPEKDGGTAGAVVTFVGVGAPWQGTAWRFALAPINLGRRVWQRVRSNR